MAPTRPVNCQRVKHDMTQSSETIAEEFAREAQSLASSELPAEVRDYAKRLLLDFCGNALRGTQTDSFTTAASAFGDIPPGDFTIIGDQGIVMPEYAALLNGIAGHSMEMDDIQNRSSIHLGVVVMPAVLAACEMKPAIGEAALKAIVAGYEVSGRVGRAIDPGAHYEKGFHPTATCGPYGAAMGAGFVLGLDADHMANALGIASVGSAGLLQFVHDGSHVKRLHPGWAAHSGIVAARLAQAGYTGPRGIFEGENGFFRAYSDRANVSLAHGPWAPYGRELLDTAIKPHATCRYNQSPVDAVLRIVREQDLQPDDVAEIRAGLLGVAVRIVGDPIEFKRRPRSIVDAQFSAPFALAVAIVRRRAGIEEHTQETIDNEQIKTMMDKVSVSHCESLDAAYPERWPAVVTITTTDGRTFECQVDDPDGDPRNPMGWPAVIDKFESMTRSVGLERRRQIIDLVQRFEELNDVSELTLALRATAKECD